MVHNFYDVLLVAPTATSDEIRAAFKRRALQVHPDKGGSEQAFHLVYQAFETLADREARRRHDHILAQKRSVVPPCRTVRKRFQGGDTRRQRCGVKSAKTKAPETMSAETKLLTRIRSLMKQLPRDVRKEVITKEFSQRQRLILEKWMVDNPETESQVASATLADSLSNEPTDRVGSQGMTARKRARHHEGAEAAKASMIEDPSRGNRAESKQLPRRCGCLCKEGMHYRVSAKFDGLLIYTTSSELQTAVEYLVVLTCVRQKMLDRTSLGICRGNSFEERLKEALASSAKEQGRSLVDANFRFAVCQSMGFLMGKRFQFRSPNVHSIWKLGKLRNCFKPFRLFRKDSSNSRCNSRHRLASWSPAKLQDTWEGFQSAVIEAWKIVGSDSTRLLQKLSTLYQANAQKHLRNWERHRMALQDKNCRPRMTQKSTPEQVVARKLSIMHQLLGTWERMLTLQQKTAHAKRKRSKQLKRKRQRQEERLRRERLRQRMKSFDFMEDLHWI